jgi:hypothetical protein
VHANTRLTGNLQLWETIFINILPNGVIKKSFQIPNITLVTERGTPVCCEQEWGHLRTTHWDNAMQWIPERDAVTALFFYFRKIPRMVKVLADDAYEDRVR